MAITFRTVLAGPDTDLTAILLDVEEPLASLGFRRDHELLRSELENDELDELEARADVPSLIGAGESLQGWNGVYAHYECADFQLGVQLYKWGSGFVNAYVDLDNSDLAHLFATRTADRFYSPLIAIAQAIRAVGGFGDAELPFDPVKPDAVTGLFFNNPDRGPFLIGLFLVDAISKGQLEYLERGDYNIRLLDGYFLSENRAFVEIESRYAK